MATSVRLILDVPVDTLFGYLADPRNRPEWQSSLRAVDAVRGSGELGTTWVDVTAVGARPRLEVTSYLPNRQWGEHGRWHGLQASLVLHFRPVRDDRTALTAEIEFWGRGVFGLLGAGMTALTPAAVRSDLRRAARLIR